MTHDVRGPTGIFGAEPAKPEAAEKPAVSDESAKKRRAAFRVIDGGG